MTVLDQAVSFEAWDLRTLTKSTATVASTLCGVQLNKEQIDDSQVEGPLKVLEPVIVSSHTSL